MLFLYRSIFRMNRKHIPILHDKCDMKSYYGRSHLVEGIFYSDFKPTSLATMRDSPPTEAMHLWNHYYKLSNNDKNTYKLWSIFYNY